jgi:hypothetical protein
MDLDIEKMQADFEKFKALTGKTGKRSKQLNALIVKLGERLVMAPSSERDEYFNSPKLIPSPKVWCQGEL